MLANAEGGRAVSMVGKFCRHVTCGVELHPFRLRSMDLMDGS